MPILLLLLLLLPLLLRLILLLLLLLLAIDFVPDASAFGDIVVGDASCADFAATSERYEFSTRLKLV